jgi:hypothetical protein
VIITSLLGFKPLLHGWLKKLKQQELNATLNYLLCGFFVMAEKAGVPSH